MTDDHYLRAELYERVREDGEVFNFLQEGSLDGVWYWDLQDPQHEWMSPRFWEVFGYDPKNKTPSNQIVAQGMLEQYGIRAQLAGDGATAVKMALSETFDLILMDIHIPVLDGLEATARIRQSEVKRVLIVAMSAEIGVWRRVGAQASGLDGHVPKPIDRDCLEEVLCHWLAPMRVSTEVTFTASAKFPPCGRHRHP